MFIFSASAEEPYSVYGRYGGPIIATYSVEGTSRLSASRADAEKAKSDPIYLSEVYCLPKSIN